MQDPSALPPLSDRSGVTDAVRVQILATEHWSLLATRGMRWNEIFSRASMFLTALSAAVVALALVAQATDFDEDFQVFALLVLPMVLLLGIGTLIRLSSALSEDAGLVIGMNRLRHAYLELAPELEPYFITGHHDDMAGVMLTYGAEPQIRPSRILSSTSVIIGFIDAALTGVIAALIVEAFEARAAVYVAIGVLAALSAALVFVGVMPYRQIGQFQRELRPRSPS